ncbi:MAG: hypothetical protein EOP06_22845 [Proteobacteria bacterium]|nr:MAG: hypothetical protein EOP06_22845 [Pseudomonadota bacterium]
MWQVISDEKGTQAIVEGGRLEFLYPSIRTLQDVKRWRLYNRNKRYLLPKNKKYIPGAILLQAAESGSLPLIKRLLRNGIPVDSEDENGETALSWVARWGSASIVALLLAHGADPNHADKWGYTPLMIHFNARNTRLLLQHGADPRALDEDGDTALHCAASTGSLDIVRLLLAAGAVHAANNKGETPLHEAVYGWNESEKRIEIARLLLATGADLNARTQEGRTPLICATRSGNPKTTAFLLAVGADPADKDYSGASALDVARSQIGIRNTSIQMEQMYVETVAVLEKAIGSK